MTRVWLVRQIVAIVCIVRPNRVYENEWLVIKEAKMAKNSHQTIAKSFKVIFLVTVVSTFLPVFEGSNAYADPPPWAPAHGYREKHHHDKNHQREEDDDDDEDRGKRVRVIPAQPVYVAPYGISQGTCNRALLGKVLGGAAGAAIGSQIGRGNGNTAEIGRASCRERV